MVDRPGRDLPRHRPCASVRPARYLPPAQRSTPPALLRRTGAQAGQAAAMGHRAPRLPLPTGWGLVVVIAGAELATAVIILIFAWSR